MSKFFEGKDFKDKFKALIPGFYTLPYKKYILTEAKVLKSKVKNRVVLEAGVGIGRLIPLLAPISKEFIGIDTANLMLIQSRKVAKKFSNVEIKEVSIESVDKYFAKNYFDITLCVWNTLGNVDNEISALKSLKKVSKTIIVTVYMKGTVAKRREWYRKVGIKLSRIDQESETFYSESGLRSKAYSEEELRIIAKKAGLAIKEIKSLEKVVWYVELV